MTPPLFTTPPSADVQPTRPTLQGTFGMAATTHWIASGTAMSVLERGGTAVDAACAAAFVLHVVEPHLNGPGGDVTGLVATADGAPPRVLMGQGPAPAGATPEHFRAEGLDLVPGAGSLAAAVPGAVDAWLVLLRDLGTWELADVLGYATGYARHGHPVLARVGTTITGVAQLFAEHWPTSAALWMPSGAAPTAGTSIANPAYADVLDRLVDAGAGRPSREARIEAARSAWGEGFVAEAVDAFVRAPHRHASGTDHAGVLRGQDMASFSAGFEDAVTLDVFGATVAKTGAWGQGPVLLQALALLEGFDAEDLDPSTPDGAHVVLEALKLALADRDAWYGDPGPDEEQVPLGTLLSPAYTAERRALIGSGASREVRPGSPDGRTPFLPPLRETYDVAAAGAAAGEPTVRSSGAPVPRASGATRGDTCHLDVVDRWGTVVSATPSGGWLQSSPTIPELGFCLGTRLQMTWLEPGAPSSLRPGRRPRTTLTPTLVLRDGSCVAGLGSPGGDQQDQWQLLYLLRTLVGGYTPQQAVDAPALHTTSMPGSFWPRTWTPGGAVVEDRLGEEVIGSLEKRGHVVTRAGDWALGRLSVVTRDPATGLLQGAANPRGDQGYAVGR
ncbi:gamma-glutamyltransferase family protein [uncultured Pseudokineococcus sp.]|uniref:gamma-glutamyltransferase family protein n=1 Tax=uncultured Pseudokineococcus sp. TaxID=1642928 RepID=UPI0026344D65|nr:gamma-glutamyltransferase [uncultured Pseudokineococcus sp.]